MNYTFHWLPALRALPDMLRGALVTVEIAVLSMILGVSIGVLLALSSRSRWTGLRALASTCVELARNTLSLFQIYMAYFGLGSFGIHLDSLAALILGITFNNAGYLAETFRGRLRAVPATDVRSPLARDERGKGLPIGRVAADVSSRLSSDDKPDGLGDPTDITGRGSRP